MVNMGTKQTVVSVFSREKKWIFQLSLLVVCLFLLLPLRSKEMVSSSVYLDGLVRRLADWSFWLKAIVSGVAVALVSSVVLVLAYQLGKFADGPSHGDNLRK